MNVNVLTEERLTAKSQQLAWLRQLLTEVDGWRNSLIEMIASLAEECGEGQREVEAAQVAEIERIKTDHRVKWPACSKYQEKEREAEG
jgi:hypothetical protein